MRMQWEMINCTLCKIIFVYFKKQKCMWVSGRKEKHQKAVIFFLSENINKFYEIKKKKKKIIKFRFFLVVLLVLRSINCTGEEKSKTKTQNTYILDFKNSLSILYQIHWQKDYSRKKKCFCLAVLKSEYKRMNTFNQLI